MQGTRIDWATHVWNPVTGCSPVSEGCQNCYARTVVERFGARLRYPSDNFEVTMHPDRLDDPKHSRRCKRIFVCSMGDLFHDEVTTEFIDRVLTTIRETPKHRYLLLTKRPERMRSVLTDYKERHGRIHDNVWAGVTAENQRTANERIPILLETPILHRFISVEPMLGPVSLLDVGGRDVITNPSSLVGRRAPRLHWVICGGETGPKARPIERAWVVALRDQCDARVPFWFKKWGHCPQIDGAFQQELDATNAIDGEVWHQLPHDLKLPGYD